MNRSRRNDSDEFENQDVDHDREELTEDEAWEIALRDHPEYRKALEDGQGPESIVDEQGHLMNPNLHLTLHAVVERQIAMDQPAGVAEVARQLADLGVAHHEIRHKIMQPVAEQIWHSMQRGTPFNEEGYLQQLRAVVADCRQGGHAL